MNETATELQLRLEQKKADLIVRMDKTCPPDVRHALAPAIDAIKRMTSEDDLDKVILLQDKLDELAALTGRKAAR